MSALVPLSGGGIAAAPAGSVEVEYLSDCDWGTWTCLPQVIRDRVRPLLHGEELACWVGESVVRRRGESHSEERKAWWGSDRVLVLVEATRPLHPVGPGKLAPAGTWVGTATVHRLAPTTVRAQTWHRATAQVAQLGEAHLTDDATEILPGPLAEMVRGGSSGACRWLVKRQGFMEQVVAYRLGEGRAVVLQARRGPAKREEALPDQPWRTRLVDAAVVEVTAYDLGGAAQDRGMLLPARMPRGQALSRS